MVFAIWEIIQLVITIVAVGIIFSTPIHRRPTDELEGEHKSNLWNEIKFGIAIAAPAVILHELAHKFLALGYGFSATYVASWFGLGIGIFLKFLAPGFIFFIPGYVSIIGMGTGLQFALVAIAGPLTNLALFLIFWYMEKYSIMHKYHFVWHTGKTINLWLFIFNMLPIPGIDGFKFYLNLWQAFAG